MNPQITKSPTAAQTLIFRTSLQTTVEVKLLSKILDNHRKILNWSVDLGDWEKILKIKGNDITAGEVISILRSAGIQSRELEI